MEEKNELTEPRKEENNELTVTLENEDSGSIALTNAIDELAKLLPTLNRWAGKYNRNSTYRAAVFPAAALPFRKGKI